MSELKLFENAQFGSVRVIMRGSTPWFVAKDVCDCLGLTNPTMALEGLADDEKMTLSNAEGHVGQQGGAQFFNIISEPGVYRLIFKSRKAEAEAFRRWVTHDVLPSIRQTGMYMPNFSNPAEAARAWAAEYEAKQKAQAALADEQAAHAVTKQNLNDLTAITERLLVQLGLSGSYLQVKGFPYIYRIATALPKDANQRFWGPIGKAVSAICRSHGGVELSPPRVATTWGQFKNRGLWDMVQYPDPQYTTVHAYPLAAMEEFKQLLISGFYDDYKFAQYLHADFKTILSSIA